MGEKRTDATMIISDLLASVLMQAAEQNRGWIYGWERRGLEWLAANRSGPMNAWTNDRLQQFIEGEDVLCRWLGGERGKRAPAGRSALSLPSEGGKS